MQIDFSDLIHPLSVDEFMTEYKDRQPLIVKANDLRRDIMSQIITWEKFSDYIHNDRAVSGFQIITPKGKLCMEKNNAFKGRKPSWSKIDYFDKKYAHDLWNQGCSIILTKASLISPAMSALSGAVERQFEGSAADAHLYCSPIKNALTFPCHRDTDNNFLVHAIGKVRWKVYDVFAGKESYANLTLKHEEKMKLKYDEVLTVGDLLYIPTGLYHKAIPQGARVSVSIPLGEGNKKRLDRRYYDFTP
tara:strand:+ start:13794 stop:14534 length:741 start_codon:yes stop_codon:yes gene_type:complete